ncbi:MAG: single-stranded DNA-binding protein [Acidimicrobiia bacterium]
MNSVCITGALMSDPTARDLSGRQVVRFRLAVDDANRKPTHVEVECWGHLARAVERYLAKSRRVAITGRLNRAAWSGSGAGECRHERVFVTARTVDFLDQPRGNGGQRT